MKIGINGYELVVSRFGFDKKSWFPVRVGSAEYVFELLKELYKSNTSNWSKSHQYQIFLPSQKTSDLPNESKNWHYVIIPKRTLWTFFDLSWQLIRDSNLDVFFSPTHYLPLYCPYPKVVSVMDLSYLHFPETFKQKDLWQLKLWTKYSINKAKKILTISYASKDDIIKYYGVLPDRVVVTYPGIKDSSPPIKSGSNNKDLDMNKVLEKYHINKPYILFVGTIQPRKNITRLIEAFAYLTINNKQLTDNKNLELVIIGKPGWMYEEIYQAPKKFGVEEKVKFLEGVNDEELAVFYKNAQVFVLPSLYEGFGLPILEAMQHGCPVITSNISSMPEAGGEAAIYVNPESVEDIADKITRVLSDEKLRKNMIAKGYQQVKKFSWEKTVRETLKVLEEVAGKK